MKKGRVYLIGAGPGDPGLMTLRGMQVLKNADVVIYDFLANESMLDGIACEKIYAGKKGSEHTLPQEEINELIVSRALQGLTVARLKGGDPFIFGRGGEEAEALADRGIAFEIIPGISSFYSAPAYAGIPLTHRDFANAFEVVTGHRRDDAAPGEDINYPDYDPLKTFVFLMGMKNLRRICASLIEKNFPADTPAAVISWGTRPSQICASGTISSIADDAEREGAGPPAIIVFGGVVSLRDKLRWFDTLPLFGKKIAVTRTRAQASALSSKLAALGAETIEFPVIEISENPDMSPLENALRHISAYDYLIFTSQNAVNIFFGVFSAAGFDSRKLCGVKIAVIGPATGKELSLYGIKPDLTPPEFVAESLLDALEKEGMSGKKILLPCSAQARMTLAEGLRGLGALVDRVHIYSAQKPAYISPEKSAALKNADMITFASSSAVNNFFEIITEKPNAVLASIGPVTSESIRKHGVVPHIEAEEYTIDGLIDAIIKYCRK